MHRLSSANRPYPETDPPFISGIDRHLLLNRKMLCMFLLIFLCSFLPGCNRETTSPVTPSSTARVTRTVAGKLAEYALSTTSPPSAFIADKDGNLWFSENSSDQHATIVRMTLTGTLQKFPLPTPHILVSHLILGEDHNIWFTEYVLNGQNSQIGRITPQGDIHEFTIPDNHIPQGITAGSGGKLWFTESGAIGSITLQGIIQEYALSDQGNNPQAITTAPDGSIWFTGIGTITHLTHSGTMSTFALPDNELPALITAGDDGTIWFADIFQGEQPSRIGSISPTGELQQTNIPNAFINAIAVGPHNELWFTETLLDNTMNILGNGKITHIGSNGSITSITLENRLPQDILWGLDGKPWFTELDLSGEKDKKTPNLTTLSHSQHKIGHLIDLNIDHYQ